MNDYDFIQIYKNMKSINDICKELSIDTSNVMSNKASQENMRKVVDSLIVEIYKMYAIATFLRSEKDVSKTNSL